MFIDIYYIPLSLVHTFILIRLCEEMNKNGIPQTGLTLPHLLCLSQARTWICIGICPSWSFFVFNDLKQVCVNTFYPSLWNFNNMVYECKVFVSWINFVSYKNLLSVTQHLILPVALQSVTCGLPRMTEFGQKLCWMVINAIYFINSMCEWNIRVPHLILCCESIFTLWNIY